MPLMADTIEAVKSVYQYGDHSWWRICLIYNWEVGNKPFCLSIWFDINIDWETLPSSTFQNKDWKLLIKLFLEWERGRNIWKYQLIPDWVWILKVFMRFAAEGKWWVGGPK